MFPVGQILINLWSIARCVFAKVNAKNDRELTDSGFDNGA